MISHGLHFIKDFQGKFEENWFLKGSLRMTKSRESYQDILKKKYVEYFLKISNESKRRISQGTKTKGSWSDSKKKCILKHNYEYNFRSSLRKNAWRKCPKMCRILHTAGILDFYVEESLQTSKNNGYDSLISFVRISELNSCRIS